MQFEAFNLNERVFKKLDVNFSKIEELQPIFERNHNVKTERQKVIHSEMHTGNQM